jgi:hypothetical protein
MATEQPLGKPAAAGRYGSQLSAGGEFLMPAGRGIE